MTPDRRPAGTAQRSLQRDARRRHEGSGLAIAALQGVARTRFAPAPTGWLHLGHVANAVFVWGTARAAGAAVLLRIEDHDRARCRPEYDAGLLEDLAWLGFAPDEGPIRQRDDDAPYAAALARLRGDGLVYGCDCSRTTFEAWADEHGRRWHGAGLPGRLPRARSSTARSLRVSSAAGRSAGWTRSSDRAPTRSRPTATRPSATATGIGRMLLSVVADDLRQGVDLVIRGRDLLAATPAQIRLGRLLGRETPAGLRPPPARPACRWPEAVEGGRRHVRPGPARDRPLAAALIGEAAAAVGLIDAPRPIEAAEVALALQLAGLRPVLHLPRVVEGVPGDPSGGVARRSTCGRRSASRPMARGGRSASRSAARSRSPCRSGRVPAA